MGAEHLSTIRSPFLTLFLPNSISCPVHGYCIVAELEEEILPRRSVFRIRASFEGARKNKTCSVFQLYTTVSQASTWYV